MRQGYQPPESDTQPTLPTTGSGVKASPVHEDGRGRVWLREGTAEEIADYKAVFAAMHSPAGRAAMIPMVESSGDNTAAIQKLLEDFSTGELFNALLARINFDGMDPRTFSLAELHGAIEGAEWPDAASPALTASKGSASSRTTGEA